MDTAALSPSPRYRSYWLGPPPPAFSALLHHRIVTLGGHFHHSGITHHYMGREPVVTSLACTLHQSFAGQSQGEPVSGHGMNGR
jgi:hypothetical protein